VSWLRHWHLAVASSYVFPPYHASCFLLSDVLFKLSAGVFSPILSTSFLLSIIKAMPTKNKYYLQLQAKKSCENFMCMAMSVFSYTHLFLLSISNQFLQ